jgi:hypothetical protein
MCLLELRLRLAVGLALGVLFATRGAFAGIPECGDMRLEDAAGCELRGNVECQASCSELGVYKKACATKLQKVCRSECTLSPEPTCTDECTVSCQQECDAGVAITCTHNCFKECTEPCKFRCVGTEDPERCVASCEATCDGECDVQCRPVVDASCYQHCIECCHGSCGAQANMDCQTTCQDKEFETCEHEFRADCDASCTGSGALFCDDKFVLAAQDIPPCVQALAARGIPAVQVKGSVSAKVGGCALSAGPVRANGALAAILAAACALAVRRRQRYPEPE